VGGSYKENVQLFVLVVDDTAVGSPRQYLEHYVFPILLPALEQMLHEAGLHRCFVVRIQYHCFLFPLINDT